MARGERELLKVLVGSPFNVPARCVVATTLYADFVTKSSPARRDRAAISAYAAGELLSVLSVRISVMRMTEKS